MSPAGPRTTSASSPRCSACTARSRALPRCAVHALSEYASISRHARWPRPMLHVRAGLVGSTLHHIDVGETTLTAHPSSSRSFVAPHSYASPPTLLITFHTSRCRVRVIHVCHRDPAAYRDEQGSAARVQCSKSSGVGAVQGGFHTPATTFDFFSLADRQPIVTFLRALTLLS